jgi:hypothetical protein
MKFAFIFSLSMLLAGCVYADQRRLAHIHETQRQLLAGCTSLGVLSETTDAGNPFTFYAERRMLVTVKQRAARLGATHIVWLHKTSQSAAAEAFRCPSP